MVTQPWGERDGLWQGLLLENPRGWRRALPLISASSDAGGKAGGDGLQTRVGAWEGPWLGELQASHVGEGFTAARWEELVAPPREHSPRARSAAPAQRSLPPSA